MTMLGERTNGHAQPSARAWSASLQRIERQLAALGETGERRVEALRDALGQFVAGELETRDGEIAALKRHIADLEQKLQQKAEVDTQVDAIQKRLEEKAARRDEAKRGPPGRQGERGARGGRGAPGKRGLEGKPAELGKLTWHLDCKRYRATPFLDGKPLATLNLRPLFEQFVFESGGGS